jgi:pimeloyl-ACP methyl ester carboxylesterase
MGSPSLRSQRYLSVLLFMLLILIVVHGCMTSNNYLLAIDNGFEDISLKSNDFHIKALIKSSGTDNLLTVYIEGDGMAWKNKYTPSTDPTPRKSLTLRLANLDPALKVAYLARPCQYSGNKDIKCKSNAIYWTTHRYSPEIIDTMNNALNRLKKITETDTVKLIGFSGGGTIAVILAGLRKDTVEIITVAANLDHKLWTKLHKVTPLYGSLNAADYAEKVQFIPQVHFVGGKDSTVSEQVVRAYLDRMSNDSSIKIVVMEKYSHTCCWAENWPELLKK